MRLPTAFLERKKIPRVIYSIQTSSPSPSQEISSLMRKVYQLDGWCFDLPSARHLESFRDLRRLSGDETLIGLGHVEAEEGVSFLGKPLHRFELKIISTIRQNFSPSYFPRTTFSDPSTSEVFTQKEIDRIVFDPLRFDKTLSRFDPRESPFLLVGERYGDWILALGRLDLLKEMLVKVRAKGFIPIYSGQWPTFVLPKAKSLDVAAYAISIHKNEIGLDLTKTYDLIKKFDKPVINLHPLDAKKRLERLKEDFSFIFEDLKVYVAIVEIVSEEEVETTMKALEGIPSLITRRKT